MSIKNTAFSIREIHEIFSKSKSVFFIGIGGISMRSLATCCALCYQKKVYGYDKIRTNETKKLEKIASVKYYSTPDNVSYMDMVVFTNAIDENNFEYRQAKKLKIPLISRANFLGYIASLHKAQIGISGMHGKSTTTAMLSQIFEYGCKAPTVFCGAVMKEVDSPYKFGGRECCIFEACEYQNSFLSLPKTDAVVLNIDYDHPDFFGSLEEVKSSFEKFISDAERVYASGDDINCSQLKHKSLITFGLGKDCTYRGIILESSKASYDENASFCKSSKKPQGEEFLVYKEDTLLAKCSLSVWGKHFVYDALCAFAVAHTNGIAPNIISQALEDFSGNTRRMEFVKKSHTGSDIFEDYAHHPTEIISSLAGLKRMGYKNILCVFQAHTYSRTYYLYDSFKVAFGDADKLIVAPIFPAREQNIFELSEQTFAYDCGGKYITDFKEIASLINNCANDCVVIMGAGDIAQKIIPLIV